MGKYRDIASGIFGMLLSAFFFYLSVQIGLKENKAIGADFIPKIVTVTMFVLFAVVCYRGVLFVKRGGEAKNPGYKPNYAGVFLTFAAILIYAACLKKVGFIVDSILLLAFTIVMMTEKKDLKPFRIALISVVSVVVIDLIFTRIFGIRLPKGIL